MDGRLRTLSLVRFSLVMNATEHLWSIQQVWVPLRVRCWWYSSKCSLLQLRMLMKPRENFSNYSAEIMTTLGQSPMYYLGTLSGQRFDQLSVLYWRQNISNVYFLYHVGGGFTFQIRNFWNGRAVHRLEIVTWIAGVVRILSHRLKVLKSFNF